MRARWLAIALFSFNACAFAERVVVPAHSEQALKDALVDLLEQRLAAREVFIDRRRVLLSLSGGLPAGTTLAVELAAFDEPAAAASPFRIALHTSASAGGEPALHATLAVTLLRDAAVARRRVRKGSIVACDSVGRERRELQRYRDALRAAPCDSGFVALRDLGAGEVIRSGDIGVAPDVAAGEAVRVGVRNGGIRVTTLATALVDANVGEVTDVRLGRPSRTRRARVIARGEAELESAP